MATFLKQSTSVDIGIGPFLDETDGKTIENTLTITQPDAEYAVNEVLYNQPLLAGTTPPNLGPPPTDAVWTHGGRLFGGTGFRAEHDMSTVIRCPVGTMEYLLERSTEALRSAGCGSSGSSSARPRTCGRPTASRSSRST